MKGLPQKQAKAIVSLLKCRTVTEAAIQAKVSEPTIWRWMKDQDFQNELQEAKNRMISQAVLQIQKATGEAVQTLRDIMADEQTPASSRVSAAKTILDLAVKSFKVEELEDRLKNLEMSQVKQ